MGRVVSVSRAELEGRRTEILKRLDLPLEELRDHARAGTLSGDEWGAWQELGDIAFLLGDD
jgi:hypothetical protein